MLLRCAWGYVSTDTISFIENFKQRGVLSLTGSSSVESRR